MNYILTIIKGIFNIVFENGTLFHINKEINLILKATGHEFEINPDTLLKKCEERAIRLKSIIEYSDCLNKIQINCVYLNLKLIKLINFNIYLNSALCASVLKLKLIKINGKLIGELNDSIFPPLSLTNHFENSSDLCQDCYNFYHNLKFSPYTNLELNSRDRASKIEGFIEKQLHENFKTELKIPSLQYLSVKSLYNNL